MFGKYFNETITYAVKTARSTGRRHYIGKLVDGKHWIYAVSAKANDVGTRLGHVDPDGTGRLDPSMPMMMIETSGAGC